MPASPLDDFQWQPQPAAAAWLRACIAAFLDKLPEAAHLAERLQGETGTRFADWIDHIVLPPLVASSGTLAGLGFEFTGGVFRHPGGLFPALMLSDDGTLRVAIRVESVADFLAAHGVSTSIAGTPLAVYRRARLWGNGEAELWAIERHGFAGFALPPQAPDFRPARLYHAEALRLRRREFDNDEAGFAHLEMLLGTVIADLGADLACDLFFAAEREYWQRHNGAAQVQKARQDRLGLGWANHDHHTYRSSRRHFARLISLFEKLGCECRERFYAGAETGWGAQVMEQPRAGIVIFADVDLSPGELAGDFAHEALPPRRKLGTVGLWCALHGEAILQAGMHHLEGRFDFDAVRAQLGEAGVGVMPPFSDFPHLRQAFTEPEIWPVDEARLQKLLAAKQITKAQAAKFRREGALGSHLETLERGDGFKGFNQKGVSDIIQRTDPRRMVK